MKSDEVFIRHMIDAIEELQQILKGRTYRDFVHDPLRMHASMRLFEIVGEAASKLSAEFREHHIEIPYSEIIGMRNKLIHHYFEVDLDILWKTYEEDLPTLKSQLIATLKDS